MHSVLVAYATMVIAACGSSGASSGSVTSGGDAGPTSTGTGSPSCTDYGGTCSKLGLTGECANGTLRVSSDLLCPAKTPDCCVAAPAAGTVPLSQGHGLVCTQSGDYPKVVGTCGTAGACALGCECGSSGGAPACDCSRGLTPAPKGKDICDVFSCGVITCSVGCSCADASKSACSCP
jgi:hypothetical protein